MACIPVRDRPWHDALRLLPCPVDPCRPCRSPGNRRRRDRARVGARRQKPVFINGNPLKGTYRRIDEGDRLCDAEAVKRMLTEQTEDSRDDLILSGHGIDDLDRGSIDIFRSMLHVSRAGHPFLDATGEDFLRRIRAWRTDRETGRDGLTVAGLLMFGTSETIRDEFPNYDVDCQEWDERGADRWLARLTTDGTWSGTLLDFYRFTWKKLTSSLKVPFRLVDGRRLDETSAHIALREALVNALVHADDTGRSGVLITRRTSMFSFRSPGGMRIPPEQAFRGGESDGRNRTLQQMFLLIGAGERAGSGVPKILKGWREQHWRSPTFSERLEPSEQTLLELHVEDLLSQEVSDDLRKRFGGEFEDMSSEQRIVLCTAVVETSISHARAMTLCDLHPVDMTKMLQGLVQKGYLAKLGQGRGSRYHLPGPPPSSLPGNVEPNLPQGFRTSRPDLRTSQTRFPRSSLPSSDAGSLAFPYRSSTISNVSTEHRTRDWSTSPRGREAAAVRGTSSSASSPHCATDATGPCGCWLNPRTARKTISGRIMSTRSWEAATSSRLFRELPTILAEPTRHPSHMALQEGFASAVPHGIGGRKRLSLPKTDIDDGAPAPMGG